MLSRTKNRLILTIFGQVIILIVCVSYIFYEYLLFIAAEKNVAEHFKETVCLVTNKRLLVENQFYRADFLIHYTVNGTSYFNWVTAKGLDQSLSDYKSENALLSYFDIGTAYPCWYDPDDPRVAVLVLHHNWLSTFPLMIPVSISIIMCYFILSTALKLRQEFENI